MIDFKFNFNNILLQRLNIQEILKEYSLFIKMQRVIHNKVWSKRLFGLFINKLWNYEIKKIKKNSSKINNSN